MLLRKYEVDIPTVERWKQYKIPDYVNYVALCYLETMFSTCLLGFRKFLYDFSSKFLLFHKYGYTAYSIADEEIIL